MPSVLGHAHAPPTQDRIRRHGDDRLSVRAAFGIIGAVSIVLWSIIIVLIA